MKKYIAFGLFSALIFSASQQGFAAEKTVTFKNLEGLEAGSAVLTDTPNGLLVQLHLTNIPPGEHAFHIHEKGICDAAAKFESAGPHYNPEGDPHGYHAEEGPHDGDMPNLTVPADGELKVEVFNEEAELNEILEGDGAALVVHANPDDYRTQPSGNAGDRLACAEIK